MATKVVDVLAGGVDHKAPKQPAEDPRLAVCGTGLHKDAVTQAMDGDDASLDGRSTQGRSSLGRARSSSRGAGSTRIFAPPPSSSALTSAPSGPVGLATKLVDILAGGVDSKVSHSDPDPRLNVGATGVHYDSVTQSMQQRDGHSAPSPSVGDPGLDPGFKPFTHHHGPGIARPNDEARIQALDEAYNSRTVPDA